MAIALKYGKVWREQFTDELIKNKELLGFASLVDVEPDYELDKLYDEKWPSIVEVKTKDGRILSARRDLPKGEPEFPCLYENIKEKFISLACDAVSKQRAGEIWNVVDDLEKVEDITELTELLVSNI